MKTIGLLSDTHSYLDPAVFLHFESCDEIWHAGDIGDQQVLRKLEAFKPVRAVYGNIDDRLLRQELPEYSIFELEGVKTLIIHICGKPGHYAKDVQNLIHHNQPKLLICGHSHILRVIKDQKNNLLYMNPGAAGQHGFHQVKTLLRFQLDKEVIKNLEVIELGKRGSLQ